MFQIVVWVSSVGGGETAREERRQGGRKRPGNCVLFLTSRKIFPTPPLDLCPSRPASGRRSRTQHSTAGPQHSATGPQHSAVGPQHSTIGPQHSAAGPNTLPQDPKHSNLLTLSFDLETPTTVRLNPCRPTPGPRCSSSPRLHSRCSEVCETLSLDPHTRLSVRGKSH